jgi:predicted nucleic acid-binding protein
MPVISNTSPILNLAIISRLGFLRDQFGDVLIPSAVLDELKPDSNFPGATIISEALHAGWIRTVRVENIDLVRALGVELDKGEAEVIALALEQKTNMILLDEQEGRTRAKRFGLTPVGVLGVLLRAKKKYKNITIKAEMESLRTKAGFYIDANLFERILAEAGEISAPSE